MNEKEILDFKSSIQHFSTDELINMKVNLQNELAKMYLNSDITLKIALVEAALEEKGVKETK